MHSWNHPEFMLLRAPFQVCVCVLWSRLALSLCDELVVAHCFGSIEMIKKTLHTLMHMTWFPCRTDIILSIKIAKVCWFQTRQLSTQVNGHTVIPMVIPHVVRGSKGSMIRTQQAKGMNKNLLVIKQKKQFPPQGCSECRSWSQKVSAYTEGQVF